MIPVKRKLAIGSGVAAGAAVAVVLAVAPAGGSPRAGAAKLNHSVCYAAATGRGLHRLTRREAQSVLRTQIEVVRRNCSANGTTGRRGAAGSSGPQGPPGTAGKPGTPGATLPAGETVVPRTTLPFASGFMTDGGNVQNLATIGPIHFDALCRHTYSPGTGGGFHMPRYPAPSSFFTTGGESEAQVIVWTETGSLTFKGQVGHRENVPPGQPDYTQETGTTKPAKHSGTDQPVADPVRGEGQHLFVAASNENPDETRATDPQTNDYSDTSVKPLSEYPSFQSSDGIIATSDGHIVIAKAMAGMDVLGAYGECVFSGVFDSIS